MKENLSSFYDYLTETSQGRSPDNLLKDTISCVAISPNNQVIVGGGWTKIVIWNAKTGELLRSIDGHSHWVLSVAISPDNKFIASGSADKTIKIWSQESGKLVSTLTDHCDGVNVVAFTPDGKKMVSGSADKTIKLWDFSTGKCLHTFTKHSQPVRCFAISSDGDILVSGSADTTIKLWDLKSKKYLHSFVGHSDWVQGVYLSPNKEELISISRDGEVKVWQAEAEENQESSGPKFIQEIKKIAINLRNLKNLNKSPNQILFENFKEKASTKNKSKIINSLAIIRWEKAFITGTDSGNLEKFSLLGLTRLQFSIKSGSNFITSVAVSSDNQIFVSGSENWAMLWNLKTGELLHPLKGGSPRLCKITISTKSREIYPGQMQQFTVEGKDQKGQPIKTGQISWSVRPEEAGNIDQDGNLTVADNAKERFKVIATATEASISNETEIIPLILTSLKITPKLLDIYPGDRQQFTVEGKDQKGQPIETGEISWSVTGTGNKIDRDGNLTVADNAKEKFKVIATATKADIRAEAEITPLILTSLKITPESLEINPGKSKQFIVEGKDQKGQPIETGEISWSVTGKGNKIDRDGNLTVADNAKEKFKVIATATKANIRAETEITPLILTSLEITPRQLEINPGKSKQFIVKGKDQKGQPIATGEISWKVTPEEAGNIDQDGNLTVADNAKEKFKVIATATKANIRAEAEITPLILTSLKITPESLETYPGKSKQFIVEGKDQKGQPIETGEISWSVTGTGNKIDRDGNLTVADNAKEKFKVITTATKANIRAEAEITPLILTSLKITPESLETYPGKSKQFIVKGKDQKGQPIETGEISWSVTGTGNKIDRDGNLTVADNAKEKFKVIATATKANIRAEAEITPLILTSLKITPESLETYPGKSKQFIVKGKDQKGQPIETGEISWSVTGKGNKIDRDGNLTVADDAKEKFKVIATATKANINAEAEITPLILTSLEITPKSREIYPGDGQQFTVEGKDQNGEPIATGKISWSVTQEAGHINQNGKLTVADYAKGKFKVIATATEENVRGKAEIIVPAVPVELRIFPEAISVKPEEPVTFETFCLDQHGEYLDFTNVNWQCTAGGSINGNGTFVGGYEQRQVTVTATAGELRERAIATLLPVLRRLEISPNTNLQLKPGDRKEFRAVGYDQYGQKINTSGIFWEATGGQIDSNGVFTVDANAKGTYRVTASESGIKYQWQLWGVYVGILAQVIDFIDKIVSFCESPVGAFLTNYLLPSSERSNDNGDTTEIEIDNPEEMGLQLGIWSWLSGKLVRAIISVLDWISNKLLKAGGISASVEVRVIPVLKRLKISPRKPRVECQKSLSFALTGFDQRGERIAVRGAEWQATDGTITAEGVLTAGDKKGYITVTAVVGEISDRVSVEVFEIKQQVAPPPVERTSTFDSSNSSNYRSSVSYSTFSTSRANNYLKSAIEPSRKGPPNLDWRYYNNWGYGYSYRHHKWGYFWRGLRVFLLPDLIEIQRASFLWFLERGLIEELESFSPITDYTGKLELHFLAKNYKLKQPKYNEREAKQRGSSYTVQMYVPTILLNQETGEMKEQQVFIGDLPLMTDRGSFIINGAERVIVNQIVRSPGVYYKSEVDKSGRRTFSASLIPNRGAWLKFETDKNDLVWVRIDKTRKLSAQVLLKALGLSDREIFDSLRHPEYFQKTIEKEGQYGEEEALMELHRKLRPGEPPTVDGGEQLLQPRFFNPKQYDLGEVGRYKLNKKLRLAVPDTTRVLTKEDILAAIDYLINLEFGIGQTDDIDHLGNRRVRSVGELLQNQIRVGLNRLERIIRERMTISPSDNLFPASLVNPKPLVAAIKEFLGSSQLSQFLDQTNPLAELTHKRRISALGPGGLTRERAGFAVRDIHPSHYGRICPIETPEGPNAGLIGSLATHAWVNGYGFIETPYFQVENGRVLREKPPVFMTADEEDDFRVAPGDLRTDSEGYILGDNVPVRYRQAFTTTSPDQVDFVAVSPVQVVSVTASLIPFLEHDDANRALMGSNMQRQAVPLLKSERPLVGTGLETQAARDSGMVVVSKVPGEVSYVDATQIRVMGDDGIERTYDLLKYARSNQDTCLNQRPLAYEGDRVEAGQVIADGSSTEGAELALGENVLVAYMPWEGYNYADAILISERLVVDDVYTSIHIEKFEIEARQTKLGPEEITREIPNVGEDDLRNLDDQGIIRIGAWVESGEILVGKVTPKGESDQPPEEKLLRAMFGEKARDVRDNSLRVPNGEKGRVVDVRVFTREQGDKLPPGANVVVRVYVAQKRKIQVGDKMAGRHGNKGVVSRILPIEDMPFLPDGRPIDMVLNPLGVPSQMNVGQIFECLLGWAGEILGTRFKCVPFDEMHGEEMSRETVHGMLHWAREISGKDWVFDEKNPGRIWLYDGRTGERFDRPVMVGIAYMLKLVHLVDDKTQARSTGPYSLVTQQPVAGKAQKGGQRLGEMEIWALEAFGAAYTLEELLTIKSDDMQGRNKALKAIVEGKAIPKPGTPESFKRLIRELQSLCLDIAAHKVEVDERTGISRDVEVDLMADLQRTRPPSRPVYESLGQKDEDED